MDDIFTEFIYKVQDGNIIGIELQIHFQNNYIQIYL